MLDGQADKDFDHTLYTDLPQSFVSPICGSFDVVPSTISVPKGTYMKPKTQTLWCAEGQHDWERRVTRGKAPRSCPEHRIVPKPKSAKQKLWCVKGRHDWERDWTHGAPPANCPEHKRILTEAHKDKMDDGRVRRAQENRENEIREIIESPRAKSCRCGIQPDMTDLELRKLCGRCCTTGYICPTLDTVMRAVYSYVKD